MRFAIVCWTLLLAAGVAVTATPLYNDPEIDMDGGGASLPISTNIGTVQPSAGCPVVSGLIQCTFDFFNDTGSILASFTFQTTINTGLSDAAAASFTCHDGGGFFLHCGSVYTSATGNLRYDFTGVNAPEGDEGAGSGDTEIGEQEGIPLGGHFIVTLRGWSRGATSGGEQLYTDLPHLNDSFTQSPEPAVAFTFGTGLLLLAAIWRRAVR
jgi:hypothetical protein